MTTFGDLICFSYPYLFNGSSRRNGFTPNLNEEDNDICGEIMGIIKGLIPIENSKSELIEEATVAEYDVGCNLIVEINGIEFEIRAPARVIYIVPLNVSNINLDKPVDLLELIADKSISYRTKSARKC